MAFQKSSITGLVQANNKNIGLDMTLLISVYKLQASIACPSDTTFTTADTTISFSFSSAQDFFGLFVSPGQKISVSMQEMY